MRTGIVPAGPGSTRSSQATSGTGPKTVAAASSCTARACSGGTVPIAGMPSSCIRSRNARACGSSGMGLTEEVFELHRGADVAVDLQLAGHVRGERVLLAVDDALEHLLGGRERALAALVALAHRDVPAVDLHRPGSGAVDD